jgi:CheY-like chemotaxis protein
MPTNVSVSRAQRTIGRLRRILVVEDDALVSSHIQNVLEESGFTVTGVASSGPEALVLAGQTAIDLALVDIKIAGPMDGIEVALAMRERFRIPAIFLSSYHDPETMARAAQARPLGFLAKPFRPSQMFNALEKAVEKLPP